VAELRLAWAKERSDTTEPVDSYAEGLSQWIAEHSDDVIGKIAVRADGEAVGMGWLAVIDRLPVPTRHNRRSGDIQSVFVCQEERKNGLGKCIIEALLDEGRARGLDRVVLHSSTSGADFYRRIGWSNSDLLLEITL
jgi:GNAT superfamily N-acetyltransferase